MAKKDGNIAEHNEKQSIISDNSEDFSEFTSVKQSLEKEPSFCSKLTFQNLETKQYVQ